MRVRCRFNHVESIAEVDVRSRLAETIHLDHPDYDLIVGGVYTVFAIARWRDGGIRVYLHTIEESDHPYPYPLEYFDIVDSTFPADWQVRVKPGSEIVISFPDWIKDTQFYEKLTDGDARAIGLYKRQRLRN